MPAEAGAAAAAATAAVAAQRLHLASRTTILYHEVRSV